MSTTVQDKSAIRKVAVLIDSLDRHSADLLLDRMPADVAQQVRDVWIHLDAVDTSERDRIIREFLNSGGRSPNRHPTTDSGEQPAKWSEPDEQTDHAPRHSFSGELNLRDSVQRAPAATQRPFQSLRAAEADKVVRILANERPQTIALVLAHLPPPQAGAILVRFSPAEQAAIARRLIDLEEADPEVLRELDQALESRISDLVRLQRRRVAGVSAVAGIIASANDEVSGSLLHNLGTFAPEVAGRLTSHRLDFNQFLRFDDISLGVVFEQADPQLVVLALWGTPPSFQRRVLEQLPQVNAEEIERQLAELGPVRLADVEEARRRLAESAEYLAMRQKIRLPADLQRLLQMPEASESPPEAQFVREVA